MAIICPTVTANTPADYKREMDTVSSLSHRIHIDLMDGIFAPSTSPDLSLIWWPAEVTADIHLMYARPMEYIDQLVLMQPHMVIIHNEASVHHMYFAAQLHRAGIKTGLAINHDTPIEYAYQIMHSFDQVLIFSGNLGFHGGQADLGLLDKVIKVRQHHPECEIAWDGGINEKNAGLLAQAGVAVLNVGGYLQNNSSPKKAYATLEAIIQK